jgi:hypothetical protein
MRSIAAATSPFVKSQDMTFLSYFTVFVLLLPLADLHRMHAALGGDRVNRLDALQGIDLPP